MRVKSLAVLAGLSVIAACGSPEPVVTDPYADLPEGTLLVRFEANPDIEPGQCNPKVHYALRTEEAFILFNANYEVVDQNLTGSGASLVNEAESGIAQTTIELSMFDAYPVPCSELEVRAQQFTCRTETDDSTNLCPSEQYEGTEIFAAFRERPDY
ncbi:MAG: hypothetical protein AAFY82_07180 [Pseudomonadota bacterium]